MLIHKFNIKEIVGKSYKDVWYSLEIFVLDVMLIMLNLVRDVLRNVLISLIEKLFIDD
jgi:hypothetical protein